MRKLHMRDILRARNCGGGAPGSGVMGMECWLGQLWISEVMGGCGVHQGQGSWGRRAVSWVGMKGTGIRGRTSRRPARSRQQ